MKYHLGEYTGEKFIFQLNGNSNIEFPVENIRSVIPAGTTYQIREQARELTQDMPKQLFLAQCNKELKEQRTRELEESRAGNIAVLVCQGTNELVYQSQELQKAA